MSRTLIKDPTDMTPDELRVLRTELRARRAQVAAGEARLSEREAVLDARGAVLDAREARLNFQEDRINNLLTPESDDESSVSEAVQGAPDIQASDNSNESSPRTVHGESSSSEQPSTASTRHHSTQSKRPISAIEEADEEQLQDRRRLRSEAPSPSPAGTAAARARQSINARAREERCDVRPSTRRRRSQPVAPQPPSPGGSDPLSVAPRRGLQRVMPPRSPSPEIVQPLPRSSFSAPDRQLLPPMSQARLQQAQSAANRTSQVPHMPSVSRPGPFAIQQNTVSLLPSNQDPRSNSSAADPLASPIHTSSTTNQHTQQNQRAPSPVFTDPFSARLYYDTIQGRRPVNADAEASTPSQQPSVARDLPEIVLRNSYLRTLTRTLRQNSRIPQSNVERPQPAQAVRRRSPSQEVVDGASEPESWDEEEE